MNTIDFNKIKWGSFTKQMKRYKTKHPRTDTVEEFATAVERHPKEFATKTKRRAAFYKNILKRD